MKSPTVSLVALVSLLASSGCIAASASPEAEPSIDNDSAGLAAGVKTATWYSGKTADLSAWKELDCASVGPGYWLRSLQVFKEPWINTDDFIARMEGQCARITQTASGVETASTGDKLIYTANHRDVSGRTDAFRIDVEYSSPTGFVPTIANMIDLVTSPGDDHLKNLRLTIRLPEDSMTPTLGEWAFSDYNTWADQKTRLECEVGWRIAGARLRYDTKNGKIRIFQILCRQS